ncbi:MAG: phage tail protein [Aequorivita sp.]|nr:phage tail protein [Aequorivita sp.]|tara:strand:+ start:12943 stop:14367 length:1425 start_codon:yes stop_codon:yes gene_type:complete
MATTYKTPGVYIEEISKFPPSVAQVETAIPAFIGYTENSDTTVRNKPKRIVSLLEYETYFGKAENETDITVTIDDRINSGPPTKLLDQKLSVAMPTKSPFVMYYAIRMYFDNGGGPCYVCSVGDYSGGSVSQPSLVGGLDELEKFDEPTLYVFPDAMAVSTADSYYSLINKALMQAQKLKDRFVIIDAFADNSDNIRNSSTLGNGVDLLKYGAAYHPFLKSVYSYAYVDADVTLAHNVTDETNTTTTGVYDTKKLNELADSADSDFNLILYNAIKATLEKQYVTLPPSSAMAGIYARVDGNRGVWKAPANVSVSSAVEPSIKITHEAQQDLNVHTSGKSINAIRSFTGKGILVWGARTLAGNDNEWKYVPVRRFFNMVEESVEKASSQFVFEPNDANTWIKVRAMIENFLTLQWRAGALAGAKPEQAFYVRVGLGQTMTADDILNGIMNIEIGMAAVRPAEFIVLKFSHKMQEA